MDRVPQAQGLADAREPSDRPDRPGRQAPPALRPRHGDEGAVAWRARAGWTARSSRTGLGLVVLAGAVSACGGVRTTPAPPGTAAAGACVPAATWVSPGSRQRDSTPDVIARAARARIVLLGEYHDRPDHHRWQLQTIAALAARRPDIVLGFEMFPRRVQPVLDRWVAGQIDTPALLRDADWQRVWGFSPDLYLPLFEFARLNKVPMRAVNVDRSLVARVGREGWAAVPAAEREGVTDPAPPTPAYEASLAGVMAAHGGQQATDAAARRRFVEAQLTWDRALAEGLADAARADPHALVIGIMGSGHLEGGQGVPHQLAALGMRDVVVLLPWDTARDCATLTPDMADAVFGIGPSVETAPDRPRLGVTLAPAEGPGARVQDVARDSVAASAGIRPGDVIVEAAGATVATPADLRTVVDAQAPGTWLPLRVRRAGRERLLVARFERS